MPPHEGAARAGITADNAGGARADAAFRHAWRSRLPVALCCRLNRPALLQHARPVQSLAFWQMRILCLLTDEQQRIGERAAVRQWVQALRLSLAPGWVRWWVNPSWRFGQRAPALLMENCAADYRLGPEAGVETMPWREWPACINQENTIWIWRQSRHGKYIDSQRIAITHNRVATVK
ncbi:hypothetical protein ROK90_17740 [Cronobacter dublinensis]|uniref:hypothetical protein n=1 Tax=Cronobacter dublinensis TaxID=413497 RepID=UPI002894DE8C|nr:hypothetical protein [Cronobacter dublinensis]MDT3667832.1 hypothetical protein [Cronobacter dublinensis]